MQLMAGAGFDDEKSLLMSQMSLEKRFGQSTIFVASTLMDRNMVVSLSQHLLRLSLKKLSMLSTVVMRTSRTGEGSSTFKVSDNFWTLQIGWIYGSHYVRYSNRFKMHARGWRSIYRMPHPQPFKGSTPINLSDRLNQVLRLARVLLKFSSDTLPYMVWLWWKVEMAREICIYQHHYLPYHIHFSTCLLYFAYLSSFHFAIVLPYDV
ncbi:hypothetical protein IFM89_003681 [Coptis chinensis]|uniref:Uncharacterized protein n=1 Tax=Coptis chinensis TaxID=261450 RepID=A0A835ME17_9MAGN|nr:hypothetical protein IFM89_003681 [Coptis chinensis]